MSYEKQNFVSGEVLYASQLNAMDEQIAQNATDIAGMSGGAVDSVNGQTGTVVLDADDVGAATTAYVDTAVKKLMGIETKDYSIWQNGGVHTTTGALTNSTTRLVTTDLIDLSMFVSWAWNSASYYSQYEFYDSSKGYMASAKIAWTATAYTESMQPDGAAYMRILIRNRSGSNVEITTDELDTIAPVLKMYAASSASGKSKWNPDKFLYIAYSGGVGAGTINSLEHFQGAALQDFDILKCDVQPTSDGYLVCEHDETFPDGTVIHDITYETAMAYTYTSGDHVCDLDEYLQICKQYGKTPYITVREKYASEIVSALTTALQKYGFTNNAIINSSTQATLTAVRSALSGVTLCLFCNPFGSSLASAYNYAVADTDCILSYFYTQESHTWEEFIAYESAMSYVSKCNAAGIAMCACIETDETHISALVAMGFDCCHYMAKRNTAITQVKADISTKADADSTYTKTAADELLSGKQDAPTTAGTAGQVLGLGDDLTPTWIDQSGGESDWTLYNSYTFDCSGNPTSIDVPVPTDCNEWKIELDKSLSANSTLRLYSGNTNIARFATGSCFLASIAQHLVLYYNKHSGLFAPSVETYTSMSSITGNSPAFLRNYFKTLFDDASVITIVCKDATADSFTEPYFTAATATVYYK